MHWWQAIILGIVEGLTEYLPVSSTGHLILAEHIMGMDPTAGARKAADAYAIFIQAGAILAVLGLYYRRVKQMILGLFGKDGQGLRMATCVIVAFLPAAIIGLGIEHWLKRHLFKPWPIVFAWGVGGVVILAVAWWRKHNDKGEKSTPGFTIVDLTWKGALIIGFAQCLAMWPGTSRSLVTIVAGVLVGMSLSAAVEFSFLLGVATLGAATCYEGLKQRHVMLAHYTPSEMAIGFVFAWIAAVISVKWMVSYLNKHGLAIFGYYRVALAAVVAALILTGVLNLAMG